jgi:hypothetical protein
MQEINIHIPFDYHEFIRSQKLVWKFMSKKFIKTNATYTVIIVIIALLLIRPETLSHFQIFDSFIIAGAIYFLFSWMGFYERRVRFFNKVKNIASNNTSCNFIFSDYGIEYNDAEKLYKHSWPLFSRFVIIENTIFIILRDSSTVLFTLSKKELGEENYKIVCDILKERLD